MFISSCQHDHFLKTCGNQYRPRCQAFRNFCIWRRPAARSAPLPRRPPWQIPHFAPCVALRRPHKQLEEKELPPPSRPSAYKASRNAQFRTNTCALWSSAVGLRKNNASRAPFLDDRVDAFDHEDGDAAEEAKPNIARPSQMSLIKIKRC